MDIRANGSHKIGIGYLDLVLGETLHRTIDVNNKFIVYEDGSVKALSGEFTGTIYATDGEFTGTVYATDGEFTGLINATGGTIGDLGIDENGIYTSTTRLDGDGLTISGGGLLVTDRMAPQCCILILQLENSSLKEILMLLGVLSAECLRLLLEASQVPLLLSQVV